MKWSLKKLELNPEQLEGTKDIELPEGAVPITMHTATLFYIQPEPAQLGLCQVFGCTEPAAGDIRFEFFVVKVARTIEKNSNLRRDENV